MIMSSQKYKVDGSGRLHGRIAIVTGASSGMGRGIALALAREGAYVVCSDLTEQCAQHGFEEDRAIPTHTVITNNGGTSAYTKCDMGNTKDIFALIAFTIEVRSRQSQTIFLSRVSAKVSSEILQA